ncbi:hypothetical protein KY346_05970 [Candidatus Woesearchaeota archaeon]|nr:hypothetical protein [Candidatus Woesearchaeota archaeon]
MSEAKIVFIRKDIPTITEIVESMGEVVTADEVAQLYEHAFSEEIPDPTHPVSVTCENHEDPLYEFMQNNSRYTARELRF